jgi:Mrp family chromosome partitioning ATPase
MNNRLHVLPAGDAIEGEEDAIEPEKIWRVLADCCTMYDAIVIDTPPVLVVADASVLARVADSVLYVVQWARTPRETVMAGLRRLRMVSDAAVKLVLSKVDLTEHARYRFKDEGYYASVYETYYGGRERSSGRRRGEIAALAAVAGDKPSFGPARGEA